MTLVRLKRALALFRTYGPSLWRPKPWASMPTDVRVGGALFSRPWQIVGGRRWSLTLHTDMRLEPFQRGNGGQNVRVRTDPLDRENDDASRG
jgi:hypothetical protein